MKTWPGKTPLVNSDGISFGLSLSISFHISVPLTRAVGWPGLAINANSSNASSVCWRCHPHFRLSQQQAALVKFVAWVFCLDNVSQAAQVPPISVWLLQFGTATKTKTTTTQILAIFRCDCCNCCRWYFCCCLAKYRLQLNGNWCT